MNALNNIMTAKFLVSQDKKWRRVVDSLAAVMCFLGSLLALFILFVYSGPQPGYVTAKTIAIVNLFASPLLGVLLYRRSDIRKIERIGMVVFTLTGTMSMLHFTMSLFVD